MPWTTADIPDLSGRIAVVTGANSGLGLETSRGLAGAGAQVVLACRDVAKGAEAMGDLRRTHPEAALEVQPLDLASLASVQEFAKRIADTREGLDLLVNNAGVMAIPRRETADGFEMQLGTNHLGHFALTGLLLPLLRRRPGARIVNVSSTAHRAGRMHWDDLQGERRYARWAAYGQSKLANLLFTKELARRLSAHDVDCIAAAAHPGYSATNLQAVGPRMAGSSVMEGVMSLTNRLFAQSAAMGALPTLYAATAPDVAPDDYIGPDGFAETWGHPKKVGRSRAARNPRDARKLWTISEELTGVRFLD